MAVGLLLAAGVALALPSETPDQTPMLNGTVRTFAQVGTNVWVGGNFTQVKTRNGTVVDNVSNIAVFDSVTGNYVDIAPMLGAGVTGSKVTDIKVYGGDVVVAGKFPGPTSTQKNLVTLDGATGQVVRWYNAEALESVLAVPALGRVYGGGVNLSAFEFATGKKLWTRAKTTVDPSLRTHALGAGYRDLELDVDGRTIWAACGCDAVVGNPAKALVKLDTEGNHDASFVAEAGPAAYGISLADPGEGSVYLAAGGIDFFAQYPKGNNGRRGWLRDTSGSAQVVEVMEGQLVVGGHFWEVADQASDYCGFRSSSDPGALDPNDECQTRKGLAAYSFSGTLDPNWDPALTGKYNLAWALLPEAATGRLYVGGEFTKVNGVVQNFYARLSP